MTDKKCFCIDREKELEKQVAELKKENLALRVMTCIASSKHPYTDDGELQDNSMHPCIDYKYNSIELIQSKRQERIIALVELGESE